MTTAKGFTYVRTVDLVERLEEYNKDWRTRAGSAKEVDEAISEIKRLRKELERLAPEPRTAAGSLD